MGNSCNRRCLLLICECRRTAELRGRLDDVVDDRHGVLPCLARCIWQLTAPRSAPRSSHGKTIPHAARLPHSRPASWLSCTGPWGLADNDCRGQFPKAT